MLPPELKGMREETVLEETRETTDLEEACTQQLYPQNKMLLCLSQDRGVC